ncbi:hypothetical protein QAD02_012772 [Eretmocerus hayati]|uniref:Uncharacterized protein n=1 Tax=Eretmocerus hayati TaxID=131215 RepID=A0ACC2P0M7_9HYME|nr:hypothetical protein QAD02_012772 [Eretmocerus hayati]
MMAISLITYAVNTRKTVIPISIHEEHFGQEGYKNVLAFRLLPHLLEHVFRRKVFADWKPCEEEMVECFVRHSETDCSEEDLEKIAADHRIKYLDKGIKNAQPFVLISGPLVLSPKFYVIIDEIIYKFESIISAMDFCFKSFHSFNLEYCLASEHL